MILPVDQTWDSLEEAYEAILDFVHRQGYGATCIQRSRRARDIRNRTVRPARNLPNEYVHLGCDVVEMKTCDQVNENGKHKKTTAKKTSTCSFGAIVMKCLSCWRIVTILSVRHNFEPLSLRALPSQHKLERKRKQVWISQMIQQGFSNDQIVQKIQLQGPNSSLDRQDIRNVRVLPKLMHKSELSTKLQMDATNDELPSHGPLFLQTPADKRRLERNMKRAYIIQQIQQGLSNTTILQQIRCQDPNCNLDRLDIANMRANLKKSQFIALQGQDLKGSIDDDPTEDHQLSKAESDDGLAEDYKLLVEEVSDEKDCKLPKTEMDDDLIGSYKFWKEKIDDAKDYKLPKEELIDQNYKLSKEETYDDVARV